jgi:alkaline phosphatase
MTHAGFMTRLLFAAVLTACSAAIVAAPTVSRLTPPSELFASGNREPVISRFVAGQRFDVQATVRPDPGNKIVRVQFAVDSAPVGGAVSMADADVSGLLADRKRTLLTPHLGSAVDDPCRAIALEAADNILDALAGRTPRGAINAARLS